VDQLFEPAVKAFYIDGGSAVKLLRRRLIERNFEAKSAEEQCAVRIARVWDGRHVEHLNQASNAILAQVGEALRTQRSMAGFNVRHVLLVGHSHRCREFLVIHKGHEKHRLAGGAAVFDGYFPPGPGRRTTICVMY
jgi:hypothetical protein